MAKTNCWDFMKCGRELGGKQVAKLGVCPASTERKLDGTHHGRNAGRSCWVVAGTLCKDQVQGVFAKKYGECAKCRFYLHVKGEEFPRFTLAPTLLSMLRE